MPTITRKASASTLTEGCLSTNSPIGRAANIITPTEVTTAATITQIWSTMPTAVMTESSENTMSMTAIWAMMLQNSLLPPALMASPSVCGGASSSRASTSTKISCDALYSRNRPPSSSTRSRPLMPWPNTWNRSALRPITQLSENSSSRRVIMAKPRPSWRARLRNCTGRRPTSTEMKMMLSTPSTISSAVSMAKAIQTFGSSRNSMMVKQKGKRGTCRAVVPDAAALSRRKCDSRNCRSFGKLEISH